MLYPNVAVLRFYMVMHEKGADPKVCPFKYINNNVYLGFTAYEYVP